MPCPDDIKEKCKSDFVCRTYIVHPPAPIRSKKIMTIPEMQKAAESRIEELNKKRSEGEELKPIKRFGHLVPAKSSGGHKRISGSILAYSCHPMSEHQINMRDSTIYQRGTFTELSRKAGKECHKKALEKCIGKEGESYGACYKEERKSCYGDIFKAMKKTEEL